MKKIFFTFLLILFAPSVAFAHFENPHESFWVIPMHWLVEHYIGLILIGVGLLSAIILTRKKSKKE